MLGEMAPLPKSWIDETVITPEPETLAAVIDTLPNVWELMPMFSAPPVMLRLVPVGSVVGLARINVPPLMLVFPV